MPFNDGNLKCVSTFSRHLSSYILSLVINLGPELLVTGCKAKLSWTHLGIVCGWCLYLALFLPLVSFNVIVDVGPRTSQHNQSDKGSQFHVYSSISHCCLLGNYQQLSAPFRIHSDNILAGWNCFIICGVQQHWWIMNSNVLVREVLLMIDKTWTWCF